MRVESTKLFPLCTSLKAVVSLLPYLIPVGQSSFLQTDKLKIGSQTMLHQVRRADKNRAGNKADNHRFKLCHVQPPAIYTLVFLILRGAHAFEISEHPPLFVSKDAGRNDCRINAGFVNIYCDAGEWIFASAYLHKTSFAAVCGAFRQAAKSHHHGLLKEMRPRLPLSWSAYDIFAKTRRS
jgi:hypothetical protein